MEELWSGSLRPDKEEPEDNPGSNVDILVRRSIIGLGVIHREPLSLKVQKAYEEITLTETRTLIAMLQEALRKAELWHAYELVAADLGTSYDAAGRPPADRATDGEPTGERES